MKKKITIFAMLLTFAYVGSAQIDIEVNPIGALFGKYSVSAEYGLNDNAGVEVALSMYSKKTDVSFSGAENTQKWSGFIGKFLYKYYFNPNNGIDKFYVFPYLRYVSRTGKYTYNELDYKDSYSAMGVGFGLGYKVAADGGFIFDIAFGAGKNFGKGFTYSGTGYDGVDTGTLESGVIGIQLYSKVAIGWRF